MSGRAALGALVLLVPLLVAPTGWGVPAAGAHGDGAGIVDDERYESPLYGYGVTWQAPWVADPAQTRSGVGASDSDLLTLGKRGGDRALRIEGFGDESGLDDPLADRAYVAALIDAFTAAFATTCVAPACEETLVAAAPDAAPPTLTYDLATETVTIRAVTSVASAETDAGRIVFAETLLTLPDDVEAALEEVQASVSVAGRPALAGVIVRDGVATGAAGGRGTPTGSPVASPAAGRVPDRMTAADAVASVGAAGGWSRAGSDPAARR